jgi:hypothetical protein
MWRFARSTFNFGFSKGSGWNGLFMTRAPQKPEDVKDEPGAEERFMRGVKKALETPPKPHDEMRLEKVRRRKPKDGERT